MAEKKDSIRNLIEQGRRAGKLTSTEISDAMEESSRVIDAEQMEKLYEELESNGIEVVDDDATDMSAVADMGEEGWMTLRIPLPRTALPSMTPLRFT